MAQWYAKNRDHVSEWKKQWYAENAEKVREKSRQHRERNIEAVRAYDRSRGHREYGVEKGKARRAAYKAILRGDLVRLGCEVCGAEKVDAHHDDYSKPLDVRWLCRAHHMQLHRRVAA